MNEQTINRTKESCKTYGTYKNNAEPFTKWLLYKNKLKHQKLFFYMSNQNHKYIHQS